jgi:hypothetical protein
MILMEDIKGKTLPSDPGWKDDMLFNVIDQLAELQSFYLNSDSLE